MIIVVLVVFGLCLGSFVNAWVWRVREIETELGKKHPDKKYIRLLSISRGRSICPRCKHGLSSLDLIPLFSWLSLRGKCRYCKQPISTQYPIVEVATALLFVFSYALWPHNLILAKANSLGPRLFNGADIRSDLVFLLWLGFLTCLIALFVYDIKWYLLPNRIVRPLGALGVLIALLSISAATRPLTALVNTALAVVIGGGLFYVLYQVSDGKWIGGGDVRLGWILGLVAGTPGRSVLFIFIASIVGTLISLPLLISKRLERTSKIPFGPLLILGLIITQLFGYDILRWYQVTFLGI